MLIEMHIFSKIEFQPNEYIYRYKFNKIGNYDLNELFTFDGEKIHLHLVYVMSSWNFNSFKHLGIHRSFQNEFKL